MAVSVREAPHPDALVTRLCDTRADTPEDPFQPELIAVPTQRISFAGSIDPMSGPVQMDTARIDRWPNRIFPSLGAGRQVGSWGRKRAPTHRSGHPAGCPLRCLVPGTCYGRWMDDWMSEQPPTPVGYVPGR